MKLNFIILLAVSLNTVYLSAQVTNSFSYIDTKVSTQAVSDISMLNNQNCLQTIQYFDGLGRPIQTVQRGITHINQQDLATLTEYDEAGREWKQWLPITSTGNGAIVPTANFTSVSSLYSDEGRPYNEAIIEPSPLNRILGNKGPGSAWADKPTTIAYEANNSTDAVAYFYVNASNNLTRGENYAQATLYKTVSKDEDGKIVEEYKDKLGQVVLKRSKDDGENVDTYYVFNDLGLLSYVLPPLAVDGLRTFAINTPIADSHDRLKKYCYLYKYDKRGNCTFKRLPGCTPIHMVYDKADRLVLSQNGNQRNKKSTDGKRMWTATKYDVLGRVVFTGTMYRSETDSTLNYVSIRNIFANELVIDAYQDNGFDSCNPLLVNYYDNYNFINDLPTTIDKTKLEFSSKTGYDVQYTPPSGGREAAGLLTGTRTYLLDGSGKYMVSVIYYDYRGRVIQTRATNHLGGYDIAYNELNFSGQPLKTLKEHSIAGSINAPLTELYKHYYDHAGRLLTTKYQINDKPEVILVNNSANDAYDELGRLRKKKRHNMLDTEEFDYNIRNWTTRIKSRTFEQKLYYNTKPDIMNDVQLYYNGNIAATTWTYNNLLNGYSFNYDSLNRCTGAYAYINSVMQVDYQFSEQFWYDKMGNIKTLIRLDNQNATDALYYNYSGNQVTNIRDSGTSQGLYNTKEYQDKAKNDDNTGIVEMSYDANGNLIKDLDRDILTIRYNVLNLPDTIQFRNGNQIVNSYDAGGRKLTAQYFTNVVQLSQPLNEGDVLKHVVDASESVYINSVHYINNVEYASITEYNFSTASATESKWFSKLYNSEGYVAEAAATPLVYLTSPEYYYFCRDHLGNVREMWRGNRRTVVQRTQYYPSGLPWAKNSGDDTELATKANNRKYNGKEFVEMHGYDTYDIVWRQYYPAIGRFQTPDPEIEEAYNESPYAMCDNNMVNRTDPDGRFWNYVAGGVVGGLMEIGTQVVANVVTGGDVTNINWKKVGVSAAEGVLTSGGSVALKISATVGAAFAQSALDGNTNLKDIAKGAAVNLGSGAVGSGASKLAKGVGEKGLEKVANKMVGSKTAITKSVQNLTNTSTKTARGVAKTVQNAEKAAAKEVKKASQSTTKSATSGVASGAYENNKRKKP